MNAVEIENLSKRYIIDHKHRSDTLRDALANGLRGLWSCWRKVGPQKEEFWALKDINLTVTPGEVLGIIGRNGAGKSTLLKLLSRITEPTRGTVRLRGRVASLLEVGTGFHPELSGRENIYLNGSILGMTHHEIKRKFDEIVEFSEVERFLDTPVKRYSSGMYVRLAFAVAAHLEPEILIVDEVLAVGDIAFQKRCLGKMQEVARLGGRTVLFVSHNLSAVRQLCSRTVLLQDGQMVAGGKSPAIIDLFLNSTSSIKAQSVPSPDLDEKERAYATDVVIEDADGKAISTISVGRPWQIRIRVRAKVAQANFVAAIGLIDSLNAPVQTVWHPPMDLPPGEHEFLFTQEWVNLAVNSYSLIIGLTSGERNVQQFNFGRVDIIPGDSSQYFQTTAGVGHVLNSMRTTYHRL